MRQTLSRREFLRRGGTVVAALTIPSFPGGHDAPPLPDDDAASRAGQSFGRVTTSRLNIHAAPDPKSEVTRYRRFDELINIFGTAQGPAPMTHNSVWFKTKGGYAYSSLVQPVARQFNRPLLPSQVSTLQPVLLQVTVPYTSAYRQATTDSWPVYRLYFATTHWAVAVERDQAKQSWYKLRNDRGRGHYYVRAENFRPILPDELAPISPDVLDKRIDINLTEQSLTAFEGNEIVLTTRVSTGTVFRNDGGVSRDFRTPVGTFRVWRKRASRHMEGGTPGIDYFDLPGVPWVSYFTGGIALHGTYWHNDYGRQRSHGCVNLTPEHAHWLYLWTQPAVAAQEEVMVAETATGTPVQVFR